MRCGGGGAAGGGLGGGVGEDPGGWRGGAAARAGGRAPRPGLRAPRARWAGRGPRAPDAAGCRSCPSGAARVGTGGRWASWEKVEASFGRGFEVRSAVPSAP